MNDKYARIDGELPDGSWRNIACAVPEEELMANFLHVACGIAFDFGRYKAETKCIFVIIDEALSWYANEDNMHDDVGRYSSGCASPAHRDGGERA